MGNTLSRDRDIMSGVPQGSVMGPLLFLFYIQDLGLDVDTEIINILKFVDDSKILGKVNDENDIEKFQKHMEMIYNWADKNHMRWNNDKFQLLRVGPNLELKENTYLFTPNFEDIIEQKPYIKDLGIYVDSNLNYKEQMKAAVRKADKKSSWIFRTFSTRDVHFMKKMWKSLVQCHLDYGSI